MTTILSTLASTYPATDPPQTTFLSIDAEDLPDIAEAHDVSAVPFVVLKRARQTLDTISGSDAAKVRAAVERHAQPISAANAAAPKLPPAQQVTRPKEQPLPANVEATKANGAAPASQQHADASASHMAKNLSGYAPREADPQTAPEFSSGATSTSTPASTTQEELNTRLSQLVRAAPAMLFMKGTPSAPQCGFSRQLVSILRENNVRYGFFNILADDEVRQGLKTFADWPTFPQLWLGGELVGGLDIVKEEVESDAEGFLGAYRVGKGRNEGGPAGAEAQAQGMTA